MDPARRYLGDEGPEIRETSETQLLDRSLCASFGIAMLHEHRHGPLHRGGATCEYHPTLLANKRQSHLVASYAPTLFDDSRDHRLGLLLDLDDKPACKPADFGKCVEN